MDIRPEISADAGAISSVITSAFLEAEHSDGNEAVIVAKLREAASLSISLVATENDRIVGHVAISPVRLMAGAMAGSGLVLSRSCRTDRDTASQAH